MEITVWAVVLAVATSVSFVYLGWRNGDSSASGGGAYWTARSESRDGSHVEVIVADMVTCQQCGRANETGFQYCKRCTSPLPEYQFTTRSPERQSLSRGD